MKIRCHRCEQENSIGSLRHQTRCPGCNHDVWDSDASHANPSETALVWFYSRGPDQCGPVSAKELERLVRLGWLSDGEQVWRDGLPEWSGVSTLDGLLNLSTDPSSAIPLTESRQEVRPPVPPPPQEVRDSTPQIVVTAQSKSDSVQSRRRSSTRSPRRPVDASNRRSGSDPVRMAQYAVVAIAAICLLGIIALWVGTTSRGIADQRRAANKPPNAVLEDVLKGVSEHLQQSLDQSREATVPKSAEMPDPVDTPAADWPTQNVSPTRPARASPAAAAAPEVTHTEPDAPLSSSSTKPSASPKRRHVVRRPISIAIPAGAVAVDPETPLVPDVKLGATWSSRWYTVTVVEAHQDGTVQVSWDDWNGWTYDMSREDLVVSEKVLACLTEGSSPEVVEKLSEREPWKPPRPVTRRKISIPLPADAVAVEPTTRLIPDVKLSACWGSRWYTVTVVEAHEDGTVHVGWDDFGGTSYDMTREDLIISERELKKLPPGEPVEDPE